MLGHGSDGTVFVAPKLIFSIDEMAGNEWKENGVPTAHFLVSIPIGIAGPGDNLASLPFPAEDACASIR